MRRNSQVSMLFIFCKHFFTGLYTLDEFELIRIFPLSNLICRWIEDLTNWKVAASRREEELKDPLNTKAEWISSWFSVSFRSVIFLYFIPMMIQPKVRFPIELLWSFLPIWCWFVKSSLVAPPVGPYSNVNAIVRPIFYRQKFTVNDIQTMRLDLL